MGKKRKPAARKQNQEAKAKPAAEISDDEIPEGFEVLDSSAFNEMLGGPMVTGKRKRKTVSPFVALDSQPWNRLDASELQFDDSSAQMISLEALDGSYYDKLFIREAPATKKQKIEDHDDDSDDQVEEYDDSDTFKEIPLFLAPTVMKEKQKAKKEKKTNERFKYILAPPQDDKEEDIVDEEEDYELEDDDAFDVEVQGVLQDDEYSDDDLDTDADQNDKNDEPAVEKIPIGDWYGADQRIIQAINEKLSITSPTTCQQLVLPFALSSRQDILLAAPTGSGKTFAFGIPILTMIMEILEQQKEGTCEITFTKPFALILAPTRELALQIAKNLKIAASKLPIRIVSIVGGMAPQKQERLLRKSPEIIVGTPGRLWNLLNNQKTIGVQDYPLTRFLVIDEADRMISQGNYKELRNILQRLAPWKPNKVKHVQQDTEEAFDAAEIWEQSNKKKTMQVARQTIICSATLTTSNFVKDFEDGKKITGKEGTYEGLLSCIDFQRTGKVVDTTTQQLTAENLSEAKILCLLEEKDYYLYYLLNQYPGRTLVFVNSIHCLHRLISLFGLLRFPAFSLHAKMAQRQRLKNLDRFQDNEHCVLLASDVAARGLDIPNIDHVIHYQIPRTSELYVHRSGRTARALSFGVSVMLVDPSDEPSFRKICKLLHKTTADIPDFPVELRYLNPIRKIVNAAREVDELLHSNRKNNEDTKWLVELANEADMDASHILEDEDEDSLFDKKQAKDKLEQKKRVLRGLLKTPLVKRGTSTRYINPKVMNQVNKEPEKKSAIADIQNRNSSSNPDGPATH